jgi:hypothetical protein
MHPLSIRHPEAMLPNPQPIDPNTPNQLALEFLHPPILTVCLNHRHYSMKLAFQQRREQMKPIRPLRRLPNVLQAHQIPLTILRMVVVQRVAGDDVILLSRMRMPFERQGHLHDASHLVAPVDIEGMMAGERWRVNGPSDHFVFFLRHFPKCASTIVVTQLFPKEGRPLNRRC